MSLITITIIYIIIYAVCNSGSPTASVLTDIVTLPFKALLAPIKWLFDFLDWAGPKVNKFFLYVGMAIVGSAITFVTVCFVMIAFRKLFM